MELREAAAVWNLAHTLKLLIEGGRCMEFGETSISHGDGKFVHDWIVDVRRIVYNDDHTYILDSVYGDVGCRTETTLLRTAGLLLSKFKSGL